MNYSNVHACKISGLLILLFGLRVSCGQLSCYFGSVDQTKKTPNQPLINHTCAAEYTHRMNLTDGRSINISYSLIHPEATQNVSLGDSKFCLVFVQNSSRSDHICDHDNICQSEGVRKEFSYKGLVGTVYCCQTNLCNTYDRADRATKEGSSSSVCYSDTVGGDKSCDRSYCMNQTTVAPNGTTLYTFGCATEKDYDPGSPAKEECKEVPSPSGRTTTCFCTGNRCNRPTTNLNSPPPIVTTPPAPLLYVTPPTVRKEQQPRSWGFIGTVAAVVLLVVLLVALVVLVVRRFRDHRTQHVTYTYTQLTADLAEERDADDEYMLIG